jgi:hypothetical protein
MPVLAPVSMVADIANQLWHFILAQNPIEHRAWDSSAGSELSFT